MLKFYYVGDYNKNVNSGLEDNLKWKWGWFFDWTSTQIISKWQNVTLIQKRGNIHTQINPQTLKALFCDFLKSLCNLRLWCHNYTTSTWKATHQHMSNWNYINKCLGYVVFESHAIFQTIGNHLSQSLNCKGDKMSKFWFVDRFHYKPLCSTILSLAYCNTNTINQISQMSQSKQFFTYVDEESTAENSQDVTKPCRDTPQKLDKVAPHADSWKKRIQKKERKKENP